MPFSFFINIYRQLSFRIQVILFSVAAKSLKLQYFKLGLLYKYFIFVQLFPQLLIWKQMVSQNFEICFCLQICFRCQVWMLVLSRHFFVWPLTELIRFYLFLFAIITFGYKIQWSIFDLIIQFLIVVVRIIQVWSFHLILDFNYSKIMIDEYQPISSQFSYSDLKKNRLYDQQAIWS